MAEVDRTHRATRGPSKGVSSGASRKEVVAPNQLTRAAVERRRTGARDSRRFLTMKTRGFRNLGGSCLGSSRYDGRRPGSHVRTASRRCVATGLAESGQPKQGLKRRCGGSCQPAGAGRVVPGGETGCQRTEGLGLGFFSRQKRREGSASAASKASALIGEGRRRKARRSQAKKLVGGATR